MRSAANRIQRRALTITQDREITSERVVLGRAIPILRLNRAGNVAGVQQALKR